MKRFAFIAIAMLAAGCGDDPPTTPSTPATPTFTAALLPANEIPAVGAPESTGSGSVTFTIDITRDAAQTITAATFNFTVNLTGFPANTPINLAHIHAGNASVASGGVVVNLALAAGQVTLANGAGGFTRTVTQPASSLSVVQDILNNPANFYFNVHSSLNPGGVARGQLVRTQ